MNCYPKNRHQGRCRTIDAKLKKKRTERGGPRAGRSTKVGRPEKLDIERVIHVACVMTRRFGLSGWSMRQLAAEFGVSAPALYHHFPNKKQLLDRVCSHVMSLIPRPPATLHWTERLRQVALSQQQATMNYPGIAAFLVRHREAEGALFWMERNIEIFIDAGFSDSQIAGGLATLSFFIHPFSLIDDKPKRRNEQLHDSALRRALRGRDAEFPALSSVIPKIGAATYSSQFRIALDRVIAGIAADVGTKIPPADAPAPATSCVPEHPDPHSGAP